MRKVPKKGPLWKMKHGFLTVSTEKMIQIITKHEYFSWLKNFNGFAGDRAHPKQSVKDRLYLSASIFICIMSEIEDVLRRLTNFHKLEATAWDCDPMSSERDEMASGFLNFSTRIYNCFKICRESRVCLGWGLIGPSWVLRFMICERLGEGITLSGYLPKSHLFW